MKRTIGIIGFGNMGSAIAERAKLLYDIIVFDKDKNKLPRLKDIKVAENNIDLIEKVDVVILAIKPQEFDIVLAEIKDYIKGKLIVSIAAGIPTDYIEKFLGKVKIIRVMPNIGAKIGASASVLCKGRYSNDNDLNFAKDLFNHLGKTWIIEERMIDAATAISGSGPAYIYYDIEVKKIDPLNVPENIKQEYIERLKKAAESVGFDAQTAMTLAEYISATSLQLISVTGLAPAELRKQVTSKGGTTEAGLEVLAKGGSLEEAAKAALRRAKELSKSLPAGRQGG